MKVIKNRTEIWGLRHPNGMILTLGYSECPLYSEAAVRSDFDKRLFEIGYVPVLIKVIKTKTYKYE